MLSYFIFIHGLISWYSCKYCIVPFFVLQYSFTILTLFYANSIWWFWGEWSWFFEFWIDIDFKMLLFGTEKLFFVENTFHHSSEWTCSCYHQRSGSTLFAISAQWKEVPKRILFTSIIWYWIYTPTVCGIYKGMNLDIILHLEFWINISIWNEQIW